MAQIIAWNDISFALGGSSVNAIEDIEITGSCETEDSESGGEKFVTRKSSKPYQIEMKAILDARLGVNVQSMAIKMTEAARCSTSGYFYSGSAKLFPCKYMMVEASIGEIVMNSMGTWLSCEEKLKLKQSTKYDGTTSAPASSSGSSGGGSSSSSSSSSKKSSTKSSSTKKSSSSDVDVVSMAAPSTSKSSTTTRVSMTGVSAKSIAAVAASRNAVNSAKKTSSSSSSKTVSSSVKKAAKK